MTPHEAKLVRELEVIDIPSVTSSPSSFFNRIKVFFLTSPQYSKFCKSKTSFSFSPLFV